MRLHAFGDGQTFYVGHGRPQRPFNQGNRTPKWCAHVRKSGGYEVAIHAWTYDRAEAIEIERKISAARNPVCNIRTSDRRIIWPETENLTSPDIVLPCISHLL